MADPTKEMRCACTQPNSPNKWRFKIAWRYYYYYYCRLLYFCWLSFCLYVPLICDGDWRLRLTGWQQSQHVPTHTHIIDFGFVISFTAISQVDVFARKTLLNNAFFCGEIWWERESTKKERENKTKSTHDTTTAAQTAPQFNGFGPKIVWLKAHYFRFDWWHRINFTVHRRQNEEIEFHDTGDFVLNYFPTTTTTTVSKRSNWIMKNGIPWAIIWLTHCALRILQFNLMSSSYASAFAPHKVFVCFNFISLIELNGDHITNAINLRVCVCVVVEQQSPLKWLFHFFIEPFSSSYARYTLREFRLPTAFLPP